MSLPSYPSSNLSKCSVQSSHKGRIPQAIDQLGDLQALPPIVPCRRVLLKRTLGAFTDYRCFCTAHGWMSESSGCEWTVMAQPCAIEEEQQIAHGRFTVAKVKGFHVTEFPEMSSRHDA